MDDDQTPRLALPLLHAGQAQKEIDHNEALALLDMAVQASVVAVGRNDPPSDPAPGDCWIVGTSPVGEWAGWPGALAGWTAGGWRLLAPRAGMQVWRGSDGITVTYDGSNWTAGSVHANHVLIGGVPVLGARGDAIANPASGATIDGEARAAIGAILAALRGHGLIAT